MNAAQAKAIPLKDLLARLGFEPHHEARGELWYTSPFREETEPSFKLTMNSKGWYDHGRGEGGNILDFVMAYGGVTTVGEALRWLDREWNAARPMPLFGSPSPARSAATRPSTAPQRGDDREPIVVEKVQPLENPSLIGYLRSRGIPPSNAQPYVQEVHYTHKGKRYFALAFANDSGGLEIRNPYYQGSTSPKDITCIDPVGAPPDAPTAVFEGFTDFLSAITMNALPAGPTRVVVLNSTAMRERGLERLRERPGPVHLFLDHDATGRTITEYFKAQLPDRRVLDQSGLYAGYKDFNAMLEKWQSRQR